ncbi:MAG TPA: MASE3 domain-containing protein [Anaerolineae bacterium]
MGQTRQDSDYVFGTLAACLLVVLLYITSRYSYLLFHSLVELFGIAIAGGIFMVAWNSRRFHGNNYLLIVGIGLLSAATFSLMHTLTYKGLGILPDTSADLPTQLWIAGRYVTALTFLIAPLGLGRRINIGRVITVYAAVTVLLFLSIFVLHNFPTAYVDGVGLTDFKKISEYVISLTFGAGAVLLYRRRQGIDGGVFRLLMSAVATMIVAELAFTLYVGVYDFPNFAGHVVMVFSSYLIYRAIIETGLLQPYTLLFRDLKKAHDELDLRVQERTTQLTGANAALERHAQRLEILRQIDRAILAAQSPSEIAQAAIEHIRRAMSCRRASVLLFDPEKETAAILAVDGGADASSGPGASFPLAALTALRNADGRTLSSLSEVAEPPEAVTLAASLRAERAFYGMEIPLSLGDHTIGALCLWTECEDDLTADARDFAGQVADSLAVAIDNAQLVEQLRASREQLQRLSHNLVEVQEDQARRIGQDLHDDAGQALTALKLGLSLIARDPECPPTVSQRAGELREATDELMERLHTLSVNLRPASLDRLGLGPAIKQYVEMVRRQSGVEIETMAIGLEGERLPPSIEISLYRVVQEAVTNIARHAQAERAGVIIERKAASVIAIIEDDGIGFEPALPEREGRLGLVGMRERIELLGGHLTIESLPGAGTTVFAEVPLSDQPTTL